MKFRRLLIPLVMILSLPGLVGVGVLPGSWSAVPPTPQPPELLLSVPGHDHAPEMIQSVSPAAVSPPDHFGYTWDDNAAYTWIDAKTGGQQVNFSTGNSVPISIGFPFPFYENTYSQVYVGVNGILTFGEGASPASNTTIPWDIAPNNLIAVFWDSLDLGSGKVYYKSSSDYLVIEWYQVTHLASNSDVLTFEVQLFKNGNIKFQYKQLDGVLDSATVGIEDGDGVDGLLYLLNASGLSINKAINFTRPPKTPRVKVLPLYKSQFAVNRVAWLSLTVRNSGENGSDTYDLSAAFTNSNWTISYCRPDQKTLLVDSDHDGKPDTGPLAQGASTGIEVKLQAPANAQLGDYDQVTLTLSSSQDSSQKATAELQGAVPASFAQAYDEKQSGMRLGLTWNFSLFSPEIEDWYSGSSLALTAGPQKNFVYVWERNGQRIVNNLPVSYTDVEYALVNRYGLSTKLTTKLTDHRDVNVTTWDWSPTPAVAANGRIGIVWVRNVWDLSKGLNSNIYLGILTPTGGIVNQEIAITNNTGWRGTGGVNIPTYYVPKIAATSDNHFVLAWMEQRDTNTGETSDIYYSVYDTAGNKLKSPTKFTTSSPTGYTYMDPNLAVMNGQNVLVTYSAYDNTQSTYSLVYAVLNSNGGSVKNETGVANSAGWKPDAVQLSTGKILLSWTSLPDYRIAYAILNLANYSIKGPYKLENPNPRGADSVSVTYDAKGHGILTWMDKDANNFIYYALVNDQGYLLTPPMISLSGSGSEPYTMTSDYGGGNAPYDGSFRVSLPLTIR